jgi:hypothetical protein
MKIPSFYQALLYPIEQRNWLKEFLLAIGIAAIPILGYFMIKGWEFEISTRVRHREERLFPGWGKPGKRLVRGFMIRFAAFLYNIPTYILLAITIWLWLGPIVRALSGTLPLNTPVQDVYGVGLGLRIGMILVTVIVAFVMNSLYWSGYLRYIETRRYVLFFDLMTNILVTLRTIWDDFFVSIYHVGAQALAAAIDAGLTALLTATGVGTFLIPILVPAVNFAFMSMFKAYLFGEMAEGAFGEDQPPRPALPQRQPFIHPTTDPRLRSLARRGIYLRDTDRPHRH